MKLCPSAAVIVAPHPERVHVCAVVQVAAAPGACPNAESALVWLQLEHFAAPAAVHVADVVVDQLCAVEDTP